MERQPTILTAADERFARTLHQMLASIDRQRLQRAHRVVAADLGIAPASRARLARRFSWCEWRPFDFAAYPPHLRQLDNYAWKPCLLWEVVREADAPVFWFDSATLFHAPLDWLLDAVGREGVFSLRGQTPLGRCCDPRTLDRLGVAPDDRSEMYRYGGAVAFDPARPSVRGLVRRWRDLALDPGCIAPPDLDRRVHRFDQAILTALLCRARREHGIPIGHDEVDISSTDPVPGISTRNKVSRRIPAACDPLVRAYYAVWKRADRMVLRVRRAGRRAGW